MTVCQKSNHFCRFVHTVFLIKRIKCLFTAKTNFMLHNTYSDVHWFKMIHLFHFITAGILILLYHVQQLLHMHV